MTRSSTKIQKFVHNCDIQYFLSNPGRQSTVATCLLLLYDHGKGQKVDLNVINNSSHCEECDVEMVVCFMVSCRSAVLIELDNHGNKSNGCRITAGNPRETVGLLSGKRLMALGIFGS